jgi:pimeloyl-ACP methyl ester carboxylesterase
MTTPAPAQVHTPTLEHHLVQTNGITLHVVQAGPADGELVILLHGFPEFWYGWRRQIDALAKAGFRVWAPDQRGYNLSEKPQGVRHYGIDTLAADVVGLIDAAGRERAVIAGHDWGAAVTWHTAITHPDRVRRIAVLNVPHPWVMMRTLRGDWTQRLKSWYMGYFQLPILPELGLSMGGSMFAAQSLIRSSRPGTFTDADIAHYVDAWSQPGAWTAMVNWYRGLIHAPSAILSQPDTARRVHVPTLIIWGVKDMFLNVGMAAQSAELCDDARLVLFDQATHWVQHEEAYQVSALLAEWFAG